jgi:phage/plasmid-associated DNA primase
MASYGENPVQGIPPERRDPTIRENLLNDPCAKTALFAWAVRGAIDWSDRGGGRNGLGIPASIDALTADYRKRLDTVGQWLDEAVETGALVKGPFEKASNADLRALYEKWCEENGASPLGLNRFAEALRNTKDLSGEKTRSGRRWKGIGITKY